MRDNSMPKERTLKDSDVNRQLLASSRRVKKLYQFFAVIIATAFISSAITLTISADGPTGFGTILEPGSLVGSYKYIVYQDSGTVYVKNGTTGENAYESADARTALQYTFDQATTGSVYICPGTYATTSTLYLNSTEVRIIGSGWTTHISVTGAGVAAFNVTADEVTLQSMKITCAGHGIVLYRIDRNTVNDIYITATGVGYSGIRVFDGYEYSISKVRIYSAGYGFHNTVLDPYNVGDAYIEDVKVSLTAGATCGFQLTGGGSGYGCINGLRFNDVFVSGGVAVPNGFTGMNITNTQTSTYTGLTIENMDRALEMWGYIGSGSVTRANSFYGIRVLGSTDMLRIGNINVLGNTWYGGFVVVTAASPFVVPSTTDRTNLNLFYGVYLQAGGAWDDRLYAIFDPEDRIQDPFSFGDWGLVYVKDGTTIVHGFVLTPSNIQITMMGTNVSYLCAYVKNRDATQFTVGLFNTTTGAAVTGALYYAYWQAWL